MIILHFHLHLQLYFIMYSSHRNLNYNFVLLIGSSAEIIFLDTDDVYLLASNDSPREFEHKNAANTCGLSLRAGYTRQIEQQL